MGYQMASENTIFGPIVYFITSFFFFGMLELAKLLADPFGEDEVDFPILLWVSKFIENQQAFLRFYINSREGSAENDGQGEVLIGAEQILRFLEGTEKRADSMLLVAQSEALLESGTEMKQVFSMHRDQSDRSASELDASKSSPLSSP